MIITMRNLLFSLFFILSNCAELQAQDENQKSIEKTGWLIYWHDKIIWVEAKLNINKCVKDSYFFQSVNEYVNGLNVKGSSSANWYGSIAKGYAISYYHNDSIINETDPKFLDSIWILPVKAQMKIKPDSDADYETMHLAFIKNRKEIFIKFKGIANYSIGKIELLRKKDKRRLKRVKNYHVYPPQ
jgi:hypothetical protein